MHQADKHEIKEGKSGTPPGNAANQERSSALDL